MKVYETELGSYMLKENVTVSDIAKYCGVERKTVYNWINKKAKPANVNIILRLAAILDVRFEVLVNYFGE